MSSTPTTPTRSARTTTGESLAAPGPPVVQVRELFQSYGQPPDVTQVLSGVNLSVARGECVFLAGPSGSGKTTLLSIIGCILSPTRGAIEVLSHDVTRLSAGQRARLRRTQIGLVLQRSHLIRGLSALDNVSLPLALQGVPFTSARARARQLLAQVGLAAQLDRPPQQMSVGQCQRVALARALVHDPPLILADEPTASLDAASGRAVVRLLQQLTRREHKTVVLVTHDPRILEFADRICWLENGHIVEQIAAPTRAAPAPTAPAAS